MSVTSCIPYVVSTWGHSSRTSVCPMSRPLGGRRPGAGGASGSVDTRGSRRPVALQGHSRQLTRHDVPRLPAPRRHDQQLHVRPRPDTWRSVPTVAGVIATAGFLEPTMNRLPVVVVAVLALVVLTEPAVAHADSSGDVQQLQPSLPSTPQRDAGFIADVTRYRDACRRSRCGDSRCSRN